MSKRGGTINSLQAGRGLAALAVVVGHSALAAHDFGAPFTGFRVALTGFYGVDFFFVLSGFIIYHSTVGRDRSVREYVIARFRRVYLPYWPIGIAIALLYVGLPTISAGHRTWSWLPTLTLLPVDSNPALSVAWTLKHEILFYAAFGLFYYADLLPLGLGIWALAIICGLPHLVSAPINLEFLFGIGACIAYRRGIAHPVLILFGVIAGLLAYATGERVLIGLMFALLIAPIAQLERRKMLNMPDFIVVLGAASYSLYLVHEPIVALVGRLGAGHPFTILLVGMAASLVGGFAYHWVIEERVVKRRLNPEVFNPILYPEAPRQS